MDKKKLLPAVALLVSLFSTPAAPVTSVNELDKQQVLLNVAGDWIAVGSTQYHRGLYEQAKKSFLQAQEYQKYLTAAEGENLSDYLKKTCTAVAERKGIAEHLQKANELTARDELIKAKAHLKTIKNNEFLTKLEQRQVAGKLKKLDSLIADQTKETARLYSLSAEYYRTNQIEKARQGFVKVAERGLLTLPQGQTAEDYLLKIDNTLLAKANPSGQAEKNISETAGDSIALDNSPIADPNDAAVIVVSELSAGSADHTKTAGSKKGILQSYTRAVMNDAITKAKNYLDQGAFNKAKEIIDDAEETLNKNQSVLGDELFREYNSRLQQLAGRIDKERTRWLGPRDTKTLWKW